MPRPAKQTTPVQSQTIVPTTALVASATRYPGKAARIYVPQQDWQRECYRHYGICGEARFAAKFFGNAVSRATLHTATLVDGEFVREKDGPAYEALAELFNGSQGQAQMLNSIGMHLTIAGECYLVGRSVDGVDLWEIISVIEMNVNGGGENGSWTINYDDGRAPVELTESDVVIRIWLPNPAKQIEADSPFRALLPILSEIEWLTRHVFAQVSSRLAGAGILLLPQGMTFPPPVDKNGKAVETQNDADAMMLTLADAMMTPLSDPGSPSALIPIIMTAPDDAIDKAKLLQFWSALDENSMALRAEAIRRFALGMDLPPEQMLGMSSNGGTGGGTSNGVSHWGAWQIEESTTKMHVEPMLDTIVNALTIGYLRPSLDGEAKSLIIYDTSALRLRPDRSKEAFELYDRGLLKAAVLLRENGFDEKDLPDDPEWKRWMLTKIASGSATPDQVQAALRSLGVTLAIPAPAPAPTQQPREARPTPSLLEHPTPKAMPEQAALLMAAAEPLVFRALERSGNRIRQATGVRPPGVPSYEMHTLYEARDPQKYLEDAWSCAPQVLEGIADPDKVIPVLDAYCLYLMDGQFKHSRERLAKWLDRVEA